MVDAIRSGHFHMAEYLDNFKIPHTYMFHSERIEQAGVFLMELQRLPPKADLNKIVDFIMKRPWIPHNLFDVFIFIAKYLNDAKAYLNTELMEALAQRIKQDERYNLNENNVLEMTSILH